MHLILLGDSIFDNAPYVDAGKSVSEQLGMRLSGGEQVSLLAVDGHLTSNVWQQLEHLPQTATHLALSVGGNDALSIITELGEPCSSVMQGLKHLHRLQERFATDYLALKRRLQALGLPLLVCTIYDAVPQLAPSLRTGLSLFNDVITRSALDDGNTILDLRALLTEVEDYSPVSPIEPSVQGGRKIASAIAKWFSDAA